VLHVVGSYMFFRCRRGKVLLFRCGLGRLMLIVKFLFNVVHPLKMVLCDRNMSRLYQHVVCTRK
jgi:hypothetical protein